MSLTALPECGQGRVQPMIPESPASLLPSGERTAPPETPSRLQFPSQFPDFCCALESEPGLGPLAVMAKIPSPSYGALSRARGAAGSGRAGACSAG